MEIGYQSYDCFKSDASDGEYDLYSSLETWSDTKIAVKDGQITRESLNAAIFEILEKSGYHGKIVAVCSRSFSRNETLRKELLRRYANVIFNDAGLSLEGDMLVNLR